MIKAVVFDIDNTLYDYDAAHEIAFGAVTGFAVRSLGLTAAGFRDLHRKSDEILRSRVGTVTAAIHNRLLRYQILLEQIHAPVFYAPRMSELYWTVFLSAVEPYPGLTACAAALKAAPLLVGIGTNMTAMYQYAKLERLGILQDIDFIVTSEEAGSEKPDRRLFDCCVEKAGCPASECVFVGDSLENDALGAQSAGLLPVWLCTRPPENPPELPAGVRRIGSLAERPARVGGL
ncbi:MAG: HAD family hydrolase [Oscillospiraceae bacterium]|nr:HAD family hydrolase [Oscillospiraceae bacterium]